MLVVIHPFFLPKPGLTSKMKFAAGLECFKKPNTKRAIEQRPSSQKQSRAEHEDTGFLGLVDGAVN